MSPKIWSELVPGSERLRRRPDDYRIAESLCRMRRASPEVGHARPRALHQMRILCVLVLLGPLVGQPGLHHQDPPGYRFFASGPCRTASGEVRYIDAPCNYEQEQPRDGVATWLVQDNATTFDCARMCDVEPACTAFEINGCRRRGGCAGKCFLPETRHPERTAAPQCCT